MHKVYILNVKWKIRAFPKNKCLFIIWLMHPLHTNNKRISAFCIFNGSFLLLLNFFLLELLPNIFHQRKKRILNCKIKLTCFFSFYEFTDALHQIRSILDRWLQRKYLKTILKTTIDSARGRQTMIAKCHFTLPLYWKDNSSLYKKSELSVGAYTFPTIYHSDIRWYLFNEEYRIKEQFPFV